MYPYLKEVAVTDLRSLTSFCYGSSP